MYNKFVDYMWYLLTTPLKKVKKSKNQWYIYFKVIGKWFDECLEDIYVSREEINVATCRQEMLPVHGSDRKMSRYEGESWDNYRYRIATYEEVKRLGGTNAGVLLAVEAIGYEGVQIKRATDLRNDPDRWAEFYLILPIHENVEHPIKFDILRRVVRESKEVGAKDNYLFLINMDVVHQEEFLINRIIARSEVRWYESLMFDGKALFDGQFKFDGAAKLNPLRVTTRTEHQIDEEFEGNVTTKYHYWTFDGSHNFDGTKKFDAEIRLEAV